MTTSIPRSPLETHHPTTTTTSSDPLTRISNDPILQHFLSPTFSSTTFSSAALSSGSSASTLEHLKSSISLLDSHLRSLVLQHHPDLLHHLSSLHSTSSSLSFLRSSISSLHSSLLRTRTDLSLPLTTLSSNSSTLSNLHSTTHLLSSTIKALRLMTKLKMAMGVGSELVDLMKGAQLHCEVCAVVRENGLVGVEVVDDEMREFVGEAGGRLRRQGMVVLEMGLEGLNQAEVGSGLQVFYNLGELRVTVEGLVEKYKAAVDIKPIGFRGTGKDVVWQRLSGCMDQLHSVMLCVSVLQRVLSKKRDPFTHLFLLHQVIQEGDPMLTERVWEAFVNSFASQMKSATTSSFLNAIFTVGYPKLYSMIENLLERVSRETDVKGVPPAISPEGKEQLRATIEVFRTAFLAQCLKHLSDHVNSVFSRGGFLSKDDISSIVMRIQEEIEAVQFDGNLTLMVLREIGKVLFLLAEKAEYQISTGPEARQITGPATPAQLKNFMICQHLQEIHTRISALLLGLPREASELLSPPLGAIYGIACDSVESLFQAMLDRLQSCILQIHDQNFGVIGMDSATDNNASPYMEELQKCILHFRSQFLSRLLPSSKSAGAAGTESISTKLARGMASRVLMFFIRHASLVRPLSESGKLRMARDMAELELAVGQNLFPVEQLGAPYRALRAFRPVIFLETSQLEASPLLQDLRPSTILHHLYSRGPDELQSPMQRNNLTPLQYSLWLDSQGEDQIWKGIKATLDDYAAFVRSRGDKEFDPVYPIMLQIGSSLAENSSQSKSTGYSD